MKKLTPKQYATTFWAVTTFSFVSIGLMILWLSWELYKIMPSVMSSGQDLVLFFIFVSITVYAAYALLSIVISSIETYRKYSEEMRKSARK